MSNFESILKEISSSSNFIFKTNLPSNKDLEVEFRPMKVMDQKALLVNSSNVETMGEIKALLQILKTCILKSSVAPEDMFIQDFIWIVMNIRMKSIGEIVEVVGTCKYCQEKTNNLSINFEKDIKVKYLEQFVDNIVEINKDLKLVLTFPKIKNVIKKKTNDVNIDILADEIDYVEFKDEIVELKDSEKIKLLENLNSKFLKKFQNFENKNDFGAILNFDFTCSHCKIKNTVNIKDNLISFF